MKRYQSHGILTDQGEKVFFFYDYYIAIFSLFLIYELRSSWNYRMPCSISKYILYIKGNLNEWVSIIALDVLNRVLGYGLSISFKMTCCDIWWWCYCCCCFSGRLKCELTMFFPISLLFFSVNLGLVEHAQFAIMICYTHFPIIMHTTSQAQFAIRGQLEKVTVSLKLL